MAPYSVDAHVVSLVSSVSAALRAVLCAVRVCAVSDHRAGVKGGGSGILYGLRVDHVLHAVASGETTATLAQPLMCLGEVAYAHALLPMLDTIIVFQPEWQLAVEKVGGITTRMLAHRAEYEACEAFVRAMLQIMMELYETMRQCDFEMCLSFHVTETEYTKDTIKALKEELTARQATSQNAQATRPERAHSISNNCPCGGCRCCVCYD